MKKEKIIVIFDGSYRSIGFVHKKSKLEFETTEYISNEYSKKINPIFERLSKENPKINSEIINNDAIGIIAKEINTNSDMFLFAVSEEFNRAGINCKLVPGIIKSTLIYISKELTTEERTQIIGELINIPNDTEEEAIKEFESMLSEIINLKKQKAEK